MTLGGDRRHGWSYGGVARSVRATWAEGDIGARYGVEAWFMGDHGPEQGE